MVLRLLVLHGFGQNGGALRAQMQPLLARLPPGLELTFPDAPNECSLESVQRVRARLIGPPAPGPWRCWWDASADGLTYQGFERTLELLAAWVADGGSAPVAVLGFSQGAIAATALIALAAHQRFPALASAILVAGAPPRAAQLVPLLAAPLALPSLHVWGARDAMREASELLVERFDPSLREVARWDGSHMVPRRGPAADAIVSFIARHASS